jgi:voltage-gated potassium channel
MQDHILIFNAPINHSRQYFERLIRQFRGCERYRDYPIQILTTRFASGLPRSLHDLGVTHFNGRAAEPASLQAVNVREAEIIVILAEAVGDSASDGISFDILHRLKETGTKAKILAECVDDLNRDRLLMAGADVVIRPIRAYPEMIIRAFTAPGAEQVIENLFNHEGDEYQRIELEVRQRWSHVVTSLVSADIGIPVAFVATDDHEVISNPHPDSQIDAAALLVIVREGNEVDVSRVREALDAV